MSGHRVVSGNTSFYAGTKFMVRALAEGLRQELKADKSGIRVAVSNIYFLYQNKIISRNIYKKKFFYR